MRVYIDLDGVLANYDKAFKEKRIPGKIEFPQSTARFFENLEPIPDAVSSVEWLSERFDVWILTAPSTNNPLCYTEKRVWVEETFPKLNLYEKLIISPDKSCVGCSDDFLIDDLEWEFKGELVLFGSEKFQNWLDVCSYMYGKVGN